MQYYVIGGDGCRYGPEDIAVVIGWAREGRLAPQTLVIEAHTGRELPAASIPALAQVFNPVAQRAGVRVIRPQDVDRPGTLAVPPGPPYAWYDEGPGPKNKVVAGLLGVLLPGLGLQRFYLGYVGIGVLQILSNVLCGIGVLWGFIEGILCFTGHLRDAEGRALRD